jgi:hypothetical protein
MSQQTSKMPNSTPGDTKTAKEAAATDAAPAAASMAGKQTTKTLAASREETEGSYICDCRLWYALAVIVPRCVLNLFGTMTPSAWKITATKLLHFNAESA